MVVNVFMLQEDKALEAMALIMIYGNILVSTKKV